MTTHYFFSGRIRSFKFAIRGIVTILRTQHNAWIHASATLAVIAAGLLLNISPGEWCWVVLAVTSVWTAEALNTSLELLCDVASPDFHHLIEKAKVVSAGSALLIGIGASVIGALVFIPKIVGLL